MDSDSSNGETLEAVPCGGGHHFDILRGRALEANDTCEDSNHCRTKLEAASTKAFGN
ncbi:hypothetical protein COLO4_23453 [Corchorus olitorius]|uniref:Uncharacterized protein n=1 Tax=Corchorus olitorius TaxID=93759 RepID=A0A1R3IGJ2_9ROSI|nr:hypothetical protein COLO4_23453 [Corchorus olitorius]